MRHRCPFRPAVALSGFSALFASPLFAQEPDAGFAEDDAIVVTATRTEQNLIDAPASIAVQDIEELRRNSFTVGTDEFRGVTGVFFRRGEGGADEFPFVSFRGSTGTEGSLSLVDGIPVIGALTLEIPAGSFICVIGRNGAGGIGG